MQASPPSSDMAKLSVDGEPTMPKVQIEPIAPSLTPVQEADKRGFAHAQSLHDLLLYTLQVAPAPPTHPSTKGFDLFISHNTKDNSHTVRHSMH